MEALKGNCDFERVIPMLTSASDSTAKTHSNPGAELEFLLPLRSESLYTLPWQPLLILQEGRAGATYSERVDKADIAKAKVEEGIAALAAALEAGNSDALTAYMTTMSRFPRYSFGNTILIAFQRPDATHVAGFNAWKSLGRSVMKGEKGIMILAPMVGRREKDEESRGESQINIPDKDSDLQTGTKRACGFKVVYVFDISQTEGKELPAFATVQGEPDAYLDRLRDLVTGERIGLTYNTHLGGAFGASYKGRIELLPNLSTAHEFSVLVHEFAHELLHRDAERRAKTTKTVRETEAEAVAFVVCHAVGLETGSQHADYIKLYQGSAETLAASLTAIQQTATRILSGIETVGQRDKATDLTVG